ncbi:MAG: DNA-directed RNA polymerase subunit alpha C-terminal domain-containing protein [Pseudonocardiaceae bacterium]
MDVRDESVQVRIEGVTPWPQAFDPDSIGVGPVAALEEIVREFEDHAFSWLATAWVRPADGVGGRALVFRRPRRVLHVIGTSKLAETFREVLRDGTASGWTLHEVPAARTLLEVAESTLGHRAYNLLAREGFTTLEELAATPGEGLMALRNLGERSLAAIRQAVTAHADSSIAHPSGAVEHHQRRRAPPAP